MAASIEPEDNLESTIPAYFDQIFLNLLDQLCEFLKIRVNRKFKEVFSYVNVAIAAVETSGCLDSKQHPLERAVNSSHGGATGLAPDFSFNSFGLRSVIGLACWRSLLSRNGSMSRM